MYYSSDEEKHYPGRSVFQTDDSPQDCHKSCHLVRRGGLFHALPSSKKLIENPPPEDSSDEGKHYPGRSAFQADDSPQDCPKSCHPFHRGGLFRALSSSNKLIENPPPKVVSEILSKYYFCVKIRMKREYIRISVTITTLKHLKWMLCGFFGYIT
jgi:hypothetical protein